MPVKVVAIVPARPDGEDEFVAAAKTCATASRAEEGVLSYELWREAAGERRFVFNELYRDQAAVDAHMASDHFRAFAMAARDLAGGRPDIIVTHAIDVP
ncbi:putative quinol monooxygenase [Sphingomonas sp.]|uniref:putative quinol monooxygenase n=1 Tax=Sphingomonas sp. TaxID=28214 RepID=UPI003B0032F7